MIKLIFVSFFHRSSFKSVPCVEGKEIDLYLLYWLVTAQGGWEKVSRIFSLIQFHEKNMAIQLTVILLDTSGLEVKTGSAGLVDASCRVATTTCELFLRQSLLPRPHGVRSCCCIYLAFYIVPSLDIVDFYFFWGMGGFLSLSLRPRP